MDEITLKINGMHCSGCSQRLEKALKNTDGIENAIVDFDSREAKVIYDACKVSTEDICEIVADVGFEVKK